MGSAARPTHSLTHSLPPDACAALRGGRLQLQARAPPSATARCVGVGGGGGGHVCTRRAGGRARAARGGGRAARAGGRAPLRSAAHAAPGGRLQDQARGDAAGGVRRGAEALWGELRSGGTSRMSGLRLEKVRCSRCWPLADADTAVPPHPRRACVRAGLHAGGRACVRAGVRACGRACMRVGGRSFLPYDRSSRRRPSSQATSSGTLSATCRATSATRWCAVCPRWRWWKASTRSSAPTSSTARATMQRGQNRWVSWCRCGPQPHSMRTARRAAVC